MDLFEVLFAHPPVDTYVEVRIGGLTPQHVEYYEVSNLPAVEEFEGQHDVYFGPALRNRKTMGKKAFAASQVCWVDIDSVEPLWEPALPASIKVFSGHGWHYYWLLDDWCTSIDGLERANRALAGSVRGDSAHNCDRVLRVPGTYNSKDSQPIRVRLVEMRADLVYSLESLQVADQIDKKWHKKIVAGDRRGYRSRSERDWAVIKFLLDIGLTDSDIANVFEMQACGDKYRDPRTHEDYLKHTINKARSSVEEQKKPFIVRDNAYYTRTRNGLVPVSTFIIEPTLLLESEEEDVIIADIRASGTDHVWRDEAIPKSAFSSMRMLSAELTKAAHVWLGHDSDVRTLLAFLIEQLQEQGMPHAYSTQVLGLHRIPNDDRWFYVASDCTVASDGTIWADPLEAPIVYVETGREHPGIEFHPLDVETDLTNYLQRMFELLTNINRPEVIWSMLGWYCASVLKPAFEKVGYRFPILNVFGTRGTGKSTTILRVFQPLLGYAEELAYDANTTRFVVLSLLSAVNAVPITFSEFRYSSVATFIRYVLLSYDTGRDPRGRADQTTTTYALTAPFSIDGEDMIEDPAALERIVAVQLTPSTVEEGGPEWCAFQDIQLIDLSYFALPYTLFAISNDLNVFIDIAEEEVFDAFPSTLPSRVRKNLTVAWTGVKIVEAFLRVHNVDIEVPDADVLRSSLELVYSPDLGRARTAADDFVEVIVNAAAGKARSFTWGLRDGVLWFQLTPAFNFFATMRARQHRSTLSRSAIKSQLSELESEYTVPPKVMDFDGKKILAYGVDLKQAADAGLDVPTSIKQNSITIRL